MRWRQGRKDVLCPLELRRTTGICTQHSRSAACHTLTFMTLDTRLHLERELSAQCPNSEKLLKDLLKLHHDKSFALQPLDQQGHSVDRHPISHAALGCCPSKRQDSTSSTFGLSRYLHLYKAREGGVGRSPRRARALVLGTRRARRLAPWSIATSGLSPAKSFRRRPL